jgi:hypothetical protein
MGLALALLIYGVIMGIIVIITSKFFGNLIIQVWTDMSDLTPELAHR